jgi:hypothetical protein
LKLDDLVKAATSRVEAVRVVRTAINPLLWLVGLVTPLAVLAAALVGDLWMRVTFSVLAFLPVIAAIAAYFMCLIRAPDRLQSEEYRLLQHALKMVHYKQGAGAEIVDVAREVRRTESLPRGFSDGDEP